MKPNAASGFCSNPCKTLIEANRSPEIGSSLIPHRLEFNFATIVQSDLKERQLDHATRGVTRSRWSLVSLASAFKKLGNPRETAWIQPEVRIERQAVFRSEATERLEI
jgi:hypothetical protein